MHLTPNLKVHFLGIVPLLEDKNRILSPEEILSLSGLLTFQGKSLEEIFKTFSGKEDFKKTVQKILEESSLRGHASMSTTPSLCLNYEGSKFLDSALTGIIFSSSIVSSGRRTETSEKDIVFPDEIFKNKTAKKIYEESSAENIKNFNYFLAKGVEKDQASKILQYGIYGTGIISLPIESILALKREYEIEKDFMPEEVGTLLKKVEEKLKSFGALNLYLTRYASASIFYPYPNIFKDPKKTNLAREIINEKKPNLPKLISFDFLETDNLKKNLENLENSVKKLNSIKNIKESLQKTLNLRQEIIRDYNSSLKFKFLSSVSWRVWSEKKRHRTCPMIIESIYFCANRACEKFLKFKKEIENAKISDRAIKEIEKVFSIPPAIKNNKEFLNIYLSSSLKSFLSYKKLISNGIKERDAIFLIPRAIKIDVLQEYDLFNLIAGYFPLRICQTAEQEMRENTEKEILLIREYLRRKNLNYLSNLVLPKCNFIGFCPEKTFCRQIKNLNKDYELNFHKKIWQEIEKFFKSLTLNYFNF